jgi:hypothetical protein
MEAVRITLLVMVYELLKVVQVLQELEASRGRRTALLYGSIWEVPYPICPQRPRRSPLLVMLHRSCAGCGGYVQRLEVSPRNKPFKPF